MFQNYQISKYFFIAIFCAKMSRVTWALKKTQVFSVASISVISNAGCGKKLNVGSKKYYIFCSLSLSLSENNIIFSSFYERKYQEGEKVLNNKVRKMFDGKF